MLAEHLRPGGLLGTWEQYAAELTMQQLQCQPLEVFRHLQTFPQHVVRRGLEETILAPDADMHEKIAS